MKFYFGFLLLFIYSRSVIKENVIQRAASLSELEGVHLKPQEVLCRTLPEVVR